MKELMDFTKDELNMWVPFFVVEMRRQDGVNYRAKTVFEFVLAIQSAFDHQCGVVHSFLSEKEFASIRNSLDDTMRHLQSIGLGYAPKKPDVVTDVMEEVLWSQGILGKSPSTKLLKSLVYLLGVNLGLRAGEHRLLRKPMF